MESRELARKVRAIIPEILRDLAMKILDKVRGSR